MFFFGKPSGVLLRVLQSLAADVLPRSLKVLSFERMDNGWVEKRL